jgi:hypothetical protein
MAAYCFGVVRAVVAEDATEQARDCVSNATPSQTLACQQRASRAELAHTNERRLASYLLSLGQAANVEGELLAIRRGEIDETSVGPISAETVPLLQRLSRCLSVIQNIP